MTEGIKIATIGGGSSYTPELVEGFIKRYDELPVRELWLVDIEEGKEKMEIVGNLAKRMVQKAGLPIDIHLTLDRREALKGADFVTTQFRVGLLDARAKDERIPLKYGVLGQETNGPGGLFKGLRTIPVILDICRDMEELCPDAWLINFTNPAGMVTEAVLRYANIKKVVGLCNVPIGIEMGVAKLLDVDHSRIRIDFAGLNHMVYGLDVYLDGVSVKDKVIEMITDPNNSSFVKNIDGLGWEPSFIKALGVLTCPYHMYYYKSREMVEKDLKKAEEEGTRAEVVQRLEKELFELYKDPNLDIKPPQLEERGGAYYSDAAVRLIHSIYTDRRDIQPVNTMNRGAIASIPSDSAVEVSCVITKDGPKPIAMGDLPVPVRGLVQQIKSFERVAAEAAVTGDYDLTVLAMTINPLSPSDTIAKQIVDDMLEAHKEHLPQFFNEVQA
ncbi:6-phospho-beta-glucosidase [Halalkalibacterium halodurans]|uniref:6-phospho-beta-glucosidase n=1 Tax=Halalkalibacterium halodurans TaxID=86665 RepID=A0A0M0KD64_ALKHA|nr:6-phospho-beta-glucosidase [Halalkalibacterium halodurans]MED4081282.1 6-phospho-beta-glucosidase [Halalkalibacterium halodurans]MED4083997.1 6-phospho-beta-glucosidase [Halalkalibacterium halodurans]MED4105998.1 6-phospho-beta-glucosidase [Halalkalibacterium halodurans]MED4107328.1 6-phospho-beta-glucosidase [Halalkalibacterium halodurans]MED4148839.1 6-phospho-beta-glucosidase [Halalkalibacterium halodurans]